jgi:hypothetical protein
MISSFLLSIITFFIVSTTTLVIISNRSKVHTINKTIDKTQKEFQIENTKHNHKVSNLIKQINNNNAKLEKNDIKNQNDLTKEKNKLTNNLNNLDKRFNSHKNITTANFIGIDNRVTNEFNRVDDEIDTVYGKMKEHRNERITNDGLLRTKILKNQQNLDTFKEKQYKSDLQNLNDKDTSMSTRLQSLASNLDDATFLFGSNLTYATETIMLGNINRLRKDTDDNLKTFFKYDKNNSFITHQNQPTFDNWFDSNYNMYQNSNFTTFDELILLADQNIINNSNNIRGVQGTTALHSELLSISSNLYKSNFGLWFKSEYSVNPNNLSNIEKNAENIQDINHKITIINSNLDQIGINDLTTEGTITLSELNTNILQNQIEIEKNIKLINSKLNVSDFATILDSNLNQDLLEKKINSNLDQNVLINKLENTSLSLSNININDVNFNEMYSQHEILKTYKSELSRVIGFENRDYYSFDDSPSGSIDTYTDTNLTLLEGTNLNLRQRWQEGVGRGVDTPHGGKFFVDSWSNIGVQKYNVGGKIEDNIYEQSLQDKFDSIDEGMRSLERGGLTKIGLYDLVNDHNTPESSISGSAAKDFETNGQQFRIGNLYTGSINMGEGGNNKINCEGENTKQVCKTVHTRLNELETSTSDPSSLVGVTVRNILKGDGSGTPFESSKLDIGATELGNLNIKASQMNFEGATIDFGSESGPSTDKINLNNEVNVNKDMHVGKDGTGQIILHNYNDLKIKTGTYDPVEIFDTFLKKAPGNDPGDYNYIQSVELDVDRNLKIKTCSSSGCTPSSVNIPDETEDGLKVSIPPQSLTAQYRKFKIGENNYTIPNTIVNGISQESGVTTFTLKSTDGAIGSDDPDPVRITSGINTRQEILTLLRDGAGTDGPADLGNKIKIGNGCLRSSPSGDLVWESACSGDGKPIWHYGNAPEPT